MKQLYTKLIIISFFLISCFPGWIEGKDKSGVAPQVLTLPKGGGAVKGLGETFAPQLNSGTGAYKVPFAIPVGRNGYGPQLALSYSSGRGNGPFGIGWTINSSRIARRTEKGIPRYNDNKDTFTFNNMELIQTVPGQFRPRYEGFFGKIFHRKKGGEDFWEVWTQTGERLYFGLEPKSRIKKNNKIYAWYLSKTVDQNQNTINYTYKYDGGTNLYLSSIRYAIYSVDFSYEKRPDPYIHYRSGFAIETELRCKEILIRLNIPNENRFDRIRRYKLIYSQSPGSGISLLSKIVQYGSDDSVFLPPLDLEYSQFDPRGSYQHMTPDKGSPPGSLANPDYELTDVNADGLADVLHTGKTGHFYWLNMGNETWAPAQPMKRMPGGVMLSDDGVLLADMDGDGKSDLLQSRGVSFGYWRNYGNEKWEEFIKFSNIPNFSFKNPNVKLMDVNGDGLTDVIHTTNRYFTYWLNLGGKSWSPPVSRRYASIFKEEDGPGTFFSDNPESDARLADMNGDGIMDMISVHNGWIRYWPHKGYLRFDKMVQMTGTPGLPFQRFQRHRFLVGDINNDGFADLVYVDVTRVYYWFNICGTAWSERNQLESVPYAQGNADVRLADMNGNGTRDLVWSTPVRLTDRKNYRFFDFVGTGNFPNLLTKINNNMGLITEIKYKPVISDFIKCKRKGKPWKFKLPIAVKVVASVKLIDNISHNEVITNYSYADGYYDGRDREFRGFAYADVHSLGDASSPGMLIKNYFYVGYSDYMGRKKAEKARALKGQLKKREVLGLDGSELENRPYQIITHYWDSAVLNEIEYVDSGDYTRKKYVVFPFLKGTLTSAFERTNKPRHTALAYEYNYLYGTVEKMVEYGEVKAWDASASHPIDVTPGDIRITTSRYAVKDDSEGYLVKIAGVRMINNFGHILSETENFYDGEAFIGLPLGQIQKGNLHRTRQRVLTPAVIRQAYLGIAYHHLPGISLNQWLDVARYEYGEFGLLKSFKDAKGNKSLQIKYDSYNLFPLVVKNPLNHTVQVEYDYIAGQLKRYTDENNAATYYIFDKLGLVERIVKPGDSFDYPTIKYKYNLHVYHQQRVKGVKTPSPPYVTTWMRELPFKNITPIRSPVPIQPGNPLLEPANYVTRTFFDGFGRIIQVRSEEPDNKVRVSGWTEFNSKGKPKTQYLPLFSSGFNYISEQKPPPDTGEEDIKIELYYDPMERLIKTINPNNTYSKVKYEPWHSVNYDAEDVIPKSKHFNTPQESYFDAYGRLIQISQYADKIKKPIKTKYQYDLNDNLVEITDATGKEENKRFVVYDLLGRKLYSKEPNTGICRYFYDENGNRIYKRDNKGQWINYQYDVMNRLTGKFYLENNSKKPVVRNIYDSGTGDNLKGRLARTEDLSGWIEYSYDPRGRLEWKKRKVNGLREPFLTGYKYDSMDRVTQVQYQGLKGAVTVDYKYDEGGHLESIPGYIKKITYNAKGQRESITYSNGVCTTYTYDPKTFWLTSLNTSSTDGSKGNIQDFAYAYDRVGNIKSIIDNAAPSGKQEYTYDSLYRLLSAHRDGALAYQLKYEYDEVNNIIRKSDLSSGELRYGENAGPYALTGYDDVRIEYDANGNMTKRPGLEMQWDFENRLVKTIGMEGTIVEYVYDAGGQRVVKRIVTGDVEKVVYYIDKGFEIRDGKEKIYIFDGSNRVACRNEDGKTTYYHADHLGSMSVRTGSNGYAIGGRLHYKPYGGMVNKNVQVNQKNPYTFTGKEKDEENGLIYFGGRYFCPKIGRFISTDQLFLEAMCGFLEKPLESNLYCYVGNNPINRIDPDGFQQKRIPKDVLEREAKERLQTLENEGLKLLKTQLKMGIKRLEEGTNSCKALVDCSSSNRIDIPPKQKMYTLRAMKFLIRILEGESSLDDRYLEKNDVLSWGNPAPDLIITRRNVKLPKALYPKVEQLVEKWGKSLLRKAAVSSASIEKYYKNSSPVVKNTVFIRTINAITNNMYDTFESIRSIVGVGPDLDPDYKMRILKAFNNLKKKANNPNSIYSILKE